MIIELRLSKRLAAAVFLILSSAIRPFAQDNIVRLNTSPNMKAVQTVFVLPGNKEDCSGRQQDSEDFAQLASVNFGAMYSVVERQYLMQILEEQELNMSGLFSEADVVQAGRLHGAQGIIFCDVGCLRGQSFITMKLIDCENGAQQWGASAFRADFRDFLDEVMSKLSGGMNSETMPQRNRLELDVQDVILSEHSLNVNPWGCGDPIDYAGRSYKTIEVDEDCWFAENISSSTYRNGEPIEQPYKLKDWDVGIGFYHDTGDDLGYLYNSQAIFDERQLCPTGWRLPLFEDWVSLLYAHGYEMSTGLFSVEEEWTFVNQLPGFFDEKTSQGPKEVGDWVEWAYQPKDDNDYVWDISNRGKTRGIWVPAISTNGIDINPKTNCIGCAVRCVMD